MMVENGTTRIFAKNVPYSATEAEIRSFFKECGNVINVSVQKERGSNRSNGTCTVEFNTHGAATKAVQMRRSIGERQIFVTYAYENIQLDGVEVNCPEVTYSSPEEAINAADDELKMNKTQQASEKLWIASNIALRDFVEKKLRFHMPSSPDRAKGMFVAYMLDRHHEDRLFDDFIHADSLHSNFYTNNECLVAIKQSRYCVFRFVKRLKQLQQTNLQINQSDVEEYFYKKKKKLCCSG